MFQFLVRYINNYIILSKFYNVFILFKRVCKYSTELESAEELYSSEKFPNYKTNVLIFTEILNLVFDQDKNRSFRV